MLNMAGSTSRFAAISCHRAVWRFIASQNRALREVSHGADACFANLESMVIRYGEGTPAIRKLGKILLDRVARLAEAYGARVELHDGRGIIRGT